MLRFKLGEAPELMMREYRSMEKVKALRINEPFEIECVGYLLHGESGDYLVRDSKGFLRAVKKGFFEKDYELVGT